MKAFKYSRFIVALFVSVFAITLTNCTVHHSTRKTMVKSKPLPPGHAKKISGSKSARNYAPGHRK